MMLGFAALAILILCWVFYPFFVSPRFYWGNDIGNGEKESIMVAFGELFSNWNEPPPLDAENLLARVSGRMKTNRGLRIDKTADEYRVARLYERGGHEVEEMWLTFDLEFTPTSVRGIFCE